MAAEAKKFTREEVAASDGKTSHRFIIDNYVYDVSKFLDEHPGGHEVLVNVVGKDATEDFEDIGHSLDAKDLMKKFRIGELVAEQRSGRDASKRQVNWSASGAAGGEDEAVSFINSWKFPVVLGLLVTVLYTYLFG
jgi:cytochrome b5